MDNVNKSENLSKKLDELAIQIEKLNLAEYLDLLRNPRRLFFVNFVGGIFRGLGMAVGFTLLGALVIYFLQRLVILNLPFISEFIARIIQLIQLKLH